MKPINKLDAAWAAGFIEGEGGVTISSGAGYRYIVIHACQAVAGKACLDALADIFGGLAYAKKDYGDNSHLGSQQMWVWHLQSQSQVLRCLRAIAPHMRHAPKREKAELAIRLLSERITTQRRLWTPEEDTVLRRQYRAGNGRHPGNAKSLARKLKRSLASITSRCITLGLSHRTKSQAPNPRPCVNIP